MFYGRKVTLDSAPMAVEVVGRVLCRVRAHARTVLALCALLVGFVVFIRAIAPHYPPQYWLFFDYLRAIGFTALFVAACVSSGWGFCRAVRLTPGSLLEQSLLGLTVGVVLFFLGVFTAGILGLLNRTFCFVWPLVLFASAVPWVVTSSQRVRRYRIWARSCRAQRGIGERAAAALLLIGILALYLQVMLPSNLCADAYWYHLPIAEHYVAAGKITRFAEGWYLGAYPQLASLLYAWAFLTPGSFLDHVMLCAHLEYALFLGTLLGVSALAERLLVGQRLPLAAAAVFLFPKLFVYDSNLNTGADHILAFFGPPLLIGLVRLDRNPTHREAVLTGIVFAGALSTKYQASYFALPVALGLAWVVMRHRKLRPIATLGLVVVAVTATHWLKNLVFYHDPLYPLLHTVLPSAPFHQGADQLLSTVYWYSHFLPQGTFWEKLWDGVVSGFTFSFMPKDWPGGFREVPIFGSLFTLLTPLLLLVRVRLRVWAVVASVHLGILVWYLTSHQDRYLQALLPWMAAVTAVAIARAWQSGRAVRWGVSALIGLQLVWGADAYFTRNHTMLGSSPIAALANYLGVSNPHLRDPEQRRQLPTVFNQIGAALPEHAIVLVHSFSAKLGLMAQTVADGPGWQGGIEYLEHATPTETHRLWRQLGITHVLWEDRRVPATTDDFAREVAVLRAIRLYVDEVKSFGIYRLGSLRDSVRPVLEPHAKTALAWLARDPARGPGVYRLPEFGRGKPELAVQLEQLELAPMQPILEADALVLDADSARAFSQERLATHFQEAAAGQGRQLFLRR